MNIREVAKAAGVSIATVSRVLNGSENVSEETRKKVLAVIKKLNYKPLYTKTSQELFKTIGVIVYDIANYHHSELVGGIEEYTSRNGFELMLSLPRGDIDAEVHILDLYFQQKVDGVIISELYQLKEYLRKFKNAGIPVVAVDWRDEEIEFDTVNVDNFNGAVTAMNYLYKNNHRKIFYIRGNEISPASRDRLAGVRYFQYSYPDTEIFYSFFYPHEGNYTYEHGYNAVKGHLEKYGLNFTAIFALNDLAAIGAKDFLNQAGYSVPDDVSIIGFDNAPFCEYTTPKLTTISQPRRELGYTAAQLLIWRIFNKTKGVPRNITLPVKLVERGSVKKISKK